MASSPATIELRQAKAQRNLSYNSLENIDQTNINFNNNNNNILFDRNHRHHHHLTTDFDGVWNNEETSITLALPPMVQSSWTSSQKALVLAVGGGCCFGFFSPAFNIAVNDPFGWVDDDDESSSSSPPLSVPVANVWFSLAFTVASLFGTLYLMHAPPSGSGLSCTSWHDYWNNDRRRRDDSSRTLGILAGCLCGMANMLQFQGGRLIGFATADLVQAFPIVSTVWDIFLFGEYCTTNNDGQSVGNHANDCSKYAVTVYLVIMYVLYISGIVCIIQSAET
jgi:hypothetical protein